MIFKQEGNIIRVVLECKNVFVFDIHINFNRDKTLLVYSKSQPIYLLSFNLQIRLLHCQLDHTSNTKIIPVSKLVDRIDLKEIIEPINNSQSCDSEFEFDLYSNKSSSINKIIKLNINSVKKLCEACIKNNHI